jgi:ABC-type transporter Mla subunit MlaD
MEEKRRYYRLGLFVIVTVAILFAILFVLGGRSRFEPTLTFETCFNQSVAGLEIGSPVKFSRDSVGQSHPNRVHRDPL